MRSSVPVRRHEVSAIDSAMELAERYRATLDRRARATELPISDQDQPVELLAFRPAVPRARPLGLLGGMGPGAGAEAFLAALQRFGDRREIVLLQYTAVPDRTAAVRAGAGTKLHREVVASLAAGLAELRRHLNVAARPLAIVCCNTAHRFLPEALGSSRDLRLVSLLDAVVSELTARPARRVLLASTTGTRLAGLYSERLRDAGIPFAEPSDDLQEVLMRAIYDGVKAYRPSIAARHGEDFFMRLLAEDPGIDGIVAGCTEIPEVIESVRQEGHRELRSFLSQLRQLDPVGLALGSVALAE